MALHMQFDDEQRLATLHAYGVLDTPPDKALDELTELAASLFSTPTALVSLIDRDRQWFKSRVGMQLQETPRSAAICDTAIRGEAVLVVPDAKADARFATGALVAGGPGIRFYAGAPIRVEEGQALGTLCVIDYEPREFSAEQSAALAVLARQAATHMELQRRNALLTALARDLSEQRDALRSAQEQADQQDELMRAAVAQTTDAWWEINFETGQSYYSPAGLAMLGRAGEDLPSDMRLWDYLNDPQELQRQLQRIQEAVAAGRNHFAYETFMRHRDGHAIPILARAFISRDANGKAIRIAGTDTDLSKRNAALQALQDEQQFNEQIFAQSPIGIQVFDGDGNCIAANPAMARNVGGTVEELRAQNMYRIASWKQSGLLARALHTLRSGEAHASVLKIQTTFGKELWMRVNFRTLPEGSAGRLMLMVDDVTEYQSAEIERQHLARKAEESLALLHNLAQRVPGVIYQFRLYPDGRSCFPFASEGIWDIYEVRPEDVREDATPVFQRLHPADFDAVSASIADSARNLQPWHIEYRVVLPEQGVRWRQGFAQPEKAADGSVLWHGCITDITERKIAEADTHKLAYFDSLTGLPNRAQLLDRIEQSLEASRRSGQCGALLFLDLDNFKRINDARGHSVGDSLLVRMAHRLTELLRPGDIVARLGGDEFVVLIRELGAERDSASHAAMAVAERVRKLIETPCLIDGWLYSGTGSIGLTMFPKGDSSVDDLLREADTAMYRAKETGRNRIAYFESAMQERVEERLALEHDLKEAIDTEQITVAIQVQVNADREPVGGELLLRWNHPRRGAVSPAIFIPIAEESGLILRLGDYVLRQACKAVARLARAGHTHSLSVNISPLQFRQDDFVEQVRKLLRETQALPEQIIFEVTEGLLIEDIEDIAERMAELARLGIRFSIDDFGTGYSSLAYLKKLPLHELKIDKSFVQDTPDDPNDTAIVRSILATAKHFKLRVVAEGVETEAQARFLESLQCDVLQGFFFARPQPLDGWLVQQLPIAAKRAEHAAGSSSSREEFPTQSR
jgi:diguanylate cyclase (GGDEF)-like protein/PAS domain S-box-containing protein